MSHRMKIGTITLTEPLVTRINHEVAAWFTDVEVQPGTYEVFGWSSFPYNDERGVTFYNIHVEAEGVIVDEYTASLWGGIPISDKPYKKKNIGGQSQAGQFPAEFNVLDKLDVDSPMERRDYTFKSHIDDRLITVRPWYKKAVAE